MMNIDISRRSVLRAGLASAVLAGLTGLEAAPARATTASDFAGVRSRWADLLSGGAIDPSDPIYANALSALQTGVATYQDLLVSSSTALFGDLPLGSNSANVTASFNRLKTMALGYVTPGTKYVGDASLAAAVVAGLDWLVAHAYTTALPTYGYGNWWDWEIGSSRALGDTATLVYSLLSAAQISSYSVAIDHFVPDPTELVQASGTTVSTGANRLDMCRAVLVRGALGDDAAKIAQAVTGISDTLPFVTTGDGLYTDGSWIQHTNGSTGIAYTGTYGTVWLNDLALMLGALAGSPWAPTDPNLGNVFFAARNAFAPVVYNGLMMDAVRGRAIARAGETDADDGLATAIYFLALAPAGDAATAAYLRSAAKGWLQRTPTPVEDSTSILTIALAQTVLTDSSVTAAPEPVAHTLFPVMDRAVHRRPGWAATLSMSSKRIAYYENGGGDNLRGWHTGDGMLYTYLDSDNTQYDDGFWPTVDPYRLPGTTASLKRLADGQGGQYAAAHPSTTWVGGTTDGEFAAVGQDLQGPWSTLVAKKSWFFLDDAIVCLGAGICASDGAEIDTVVENRKLGVSSGAVLTVDGRPQSTTAGTTTFRGASWAHLAGASGYIFPGGADVMALRERRSGSWHDISTGGPTAALSRDYQTLYVDHGTAPAGQGYSYVLMPGAAKNTVAQRAGQSTWLTTLANTERQQGIDIAGLGVTAVNFWTAGTAGPITADAPVSVLIRKIGSGRAVVCIADPAAANTSTTITWKHPVSAVLFKPASVTSVSTGRSLSVTLGDLTTAAGATQQIVVQLG